MTSQEVVFAEAEPSDASEVSRFLADLTEESDFVTKDSPALEIEEMAQFLQGQLESIAGLCLLAKLGERVIGLVNLVPQSDGDSLSGDIFIGVEAAYRGRGIGHLLLEATIDWAQQMAVLDRLSLSVQARNARAIHLYQKFGFTVIKEQAASVLSRSGEWLDVYDMVKKLA